jgi:hypothetical protein
MGRHFDSSLLLMTSQSTRWQGAKAAINREMLKFGFKRRSERFFTLDG